MTRPSWLEVQDRLVAAAVAVAECRELASRDDLIEDLRFWAAAYAYYQRRIGVC